ncbi:MAG: sulfotransferase family protein [Acidobacteria bacterium]|nr:MAG: sulfotransferase family protein [Acidobacteriota bacterium]
MYRRVRYGRPIVVVSGLPRSGTSMAMKMLEAGGLSVVSDGLRAADEDNPKGYYEDERVKDLYREGDKAWLRESRGKVIKVISFLLKSLPPDNNYKVLFMHRNLKEIVASQNKMLARRGEKNDTSDERAVALLDEQVRDARFFLRRPQFDVLELNYREILDAPGPVAVKMAAFVGGPLDVEKMKQVVDVQLYRNRA